MKKQYTIRLEGCDDTTEFLFDCTSAEVDLLHRVAEVANKTSYYTCMPRMKILEGDPLNLSEPSS